MPLTKEDLQAVGNLLVPINTKLDLLLAGKVAPGAEAVAKKATVAICTKYSSSPIGHGMLIEIERETYLISAAHVLVGLEEKSKVRLEWTALGGIQTFQATVRELYLDERYIKCGSHDIGCVKVELAADKGCLLRNFDLAFVSGSNSVEMGKVVLGLGHVYLRGHLVHMNANNRVMVQAISAPGCSGCPLFQHDKTLVAFVHGSSKHRHSVVADIHNPSNSVFADVLVDCKLLRVKEHQKVREVLSIAEDVTPEEEQSATEEFLYFSEDCPMILRRLTAALSAGDWDADSKETLEEWFGVDRHLLSCSLKTVMEDVAKIALLPETELNIGTTLSYLSPAPSDIEMSAGVSGTQTSAITPEKPDKRE